MKFRCEFTEDEILELIAKDLNIKKEDIIYNNFMPVFGEKIRYVEYVKD